MATQQRIVRVRRDYNQWVANQTLEDYALRFTAKSARRWSSLRVANTAIGAISFLALEAIGGTITLNYGFANAGAAILAVSALIFAAGLPICFYAAKYGVDIDLLTRGAGFGYIGSTITSIIYASFTFIFFAIEAVIMSMALKMCFGLPLEIGYLVSSLAVVPLVTHGITFISRFQLWTQPIWIVLHLLPLVFIALSSAASFRDWTHFTAPSSDGAPFDLLMFGAAASVVFALIAQIGEQVDFLRFLPDQPGRRRISWWGALLSAGPGWIVLGAAKLLVGSFLAFLALQHGVPRGNAAEPTEMYRIAFQYVFLSPDAAIVLTAIFVVVSQLKINVTNSYAGSIAWSNFFSRLTHSHPGRVVWLVFNVALAVLLMELGIYKALEQVLGLYSNLAAAWVGALVADLVVNKPLGLSPAHIEFKRAHLYDINPVGVGAMVIATVASALAFCGMLGATLQAFTPFVAFATAFVMAPAIAWATDGRYYIARKPRKQWSGRPALRCCICEHEFEPEDTAFCPAYAGPICSLCCSLDARCHDSCKPHARLSNQLVAVLGALLPRPIMARLNAPLGHYLGVLLILASVIGAILMVIYANAVAHAGADPRIIGGAFWKLFFILMLIAGVAAWLFVLAQESRRVAQEESRRQTTLLMREIQAHKRTDAQYQKAKEVAEAANLAKSRFVVGISHELRTPLNAVLGYAQLLERDSSIPRHRRDAIRVIRRSGEHLSGLIEGLLDISKIEAGRLHLRRDEVRILEFLDQLVDMFRLQAAAKGIDFLFDRPEALPPVVYTDEKRLRQILINLLSNAIKFTDRGHVALGVRWRSQVAEFEIADTGFGIRKEDLERIFEPFERLGPPGGDVTPGIGLGLTITKLLTEIMGGEISVASEPGRGSRFKVKLMLSEVMRPRSVPPAERHALGYAGPRRTVVIADDDPAHRQLVEELLAPLGFLVFGAPDGRSCLAFAEQCKPDLFLLDVSMPGMDGWELARALRHTGYADAAILMISANAGEANPIGASEAIHDGYLMKPINLAELLEVIGRLLAVEWVREAAEPASVERAVVTMASAGIPSRRYIEDLRQLGEIGYVRGIQAKLDEIANAHPGHEVFVAQMRALVRDMKLGQYMATLEALHGNDTEVT